MQAVSSPNASSISFLAIEDPYPYAFQHWIRNGIRHLENLPVNIDDRIVLFVAVLFIVVITPLAMLIGFLGASAFLIKALADKIKYLLLHRDLENRHLELKNAHLKLQNAQPTDGSSKVFREVHDYKNYMFVLDPTLIDGAEVWRKDGSVMEYIWNNYSSPYAVEEVQEVERNLEWLRLTHKAIRAKDLVLHDLLLASCFAAMVIPGLWPWGMVFLAEIRSKRVWIDWTDSAEFEMEINLLGSTQFHIHKCAEALREKKGNVKSAVKRRS